MKEQNDPIIRKFKEFLEKGQGEAPIKPLRGIDPD
jgi:hypothetical protein